MWLSLTALPDSSSSDGAAYVSSSTNLTTNGLLRRLSSTSGRRMMSGGSVTRTLLCRLSDCSRLRLVRLRGRALSSLSLTTSETSDVTRPSSVGRQVRRFPPRYKISSLHPTHRSPAGCSITETRHNVQPASSRPAVFEILAVKMAKIGVSEAQNGPPEPLS